MVLAVGISPTLALYSIELAVDLNLIYHDDG
jgi:hypothetical protein